jgi:DGQHR domain-containing protein
MSEEGTMAVAIEEMPVGTRRFNEWAQEVATSGSTSHILDVHQTRDGNMIFATMNPAAMAELLFVSDWTITDQDSPSPDKRGYQRPIKSARIPTIARYFIEHEDAGDLRIPPVILSVRHVSPADRETFVHLLRSGDIEGIHSRFSQRAVCIVDGQHRTGGGFEALLRRGGSFDVPFPAVLYFDLSYETEADWFTVINSTAQPIPKSLLEWTKLDITEANKDSVEQRIRRITEKLATEPLAPFEGEVNFGGGRQLGRHITFEGLRRSTTDFFGGPKAKLLERLAEEEVNPFEFVRDYWRVVIDACSEAWLADPTGPVRYRIKELVAIAALAKLGSTLTEQAIIQGKHGPKIAGFVADKASRLSSVDWTKDDSNPWMRPQAGFAAARPILAKERVARPSRTTHVMCYALPQRAILGALMETRSRSSNRVITTPGAEEPPTSAVVLLRAMLALQVADREDRLTGREPRRTELVLVDAGLNLGDAAILTGKNYDAVRMTVSRAKKVVVQHERTESKNG